MQIMATIRRGFPRLAAATFAAAATLGLALPARAVTPRPVPVTDSIVLQPNATHEFILDCGSTYKAVGGGWLTQTPYTRVWQSFPEANSPGRWHIKVTSFNNVAETVWANATCVKDFVSFTIPQPGSTGSIPQGTFKTATSQCDSQRKAMGGGFIAQSPAFVIVSSFLEPAANGWRIRAYNASSSSSAVAALVTCSGSLGTRAITTSQVTVQPNQGWVQWGTCPSHQWLASGGFKSTVDTNWTILTGSLPYSQNGRQWKWNLQNFDTVNHTYDLSLVCFNL